MAVAAAAAVVWALPATRSGYDLGIAAALRSRLLPLVAGLQAATRSRAWALLLATTGLKDVWIAMDSAD